VDRPSTVNRRAIPVLIRRRIGDLRRQRQGHHWVSVMMDRTIEHRVVRLKLARCDPVEISGDGRSRLPSKSYTSVHYYPDFDLLAPSDTGRFKVVICEPVLEHVADPGRATRILAALCRPGATVVVSTPFMPRIHPSSIDLSRFTPSGLNAVLVLATLPEDVPSPQDDPGGQR
jgi:hypothetical protein